MPARVLCLFLALSQLALAIDLSHHVKGKAKDHNLWGLFETVLSKSKFISLSHVLEPDSPVWKGFGPSQFNPTVNPTTGEAYTYEKDGFEATSYTLATDQYGSQLDPPAHWNPNYPAIDEIPPSVSLRQLVVIDMHKQVKKDINYALTVQDIKDWEAEYGDIPEGSVVFVRSDWSKRWNVEGIQLEPKFPGVSLDALKFLHLERKILFHGHEPLDTDSTPTLEGEDWLMNNGYMQAEGVTNLHLVPATGCLLSTGFPRLRGGVGGFASYTAICPEETPNGVSIGDVPDSPFDKIAAPLHWVDGARRRCAATDDCAGAGAA